MKKVLNAGALLLSLVLCTAAHAESKTVADLPWQAGPTVGQIAGAAKIDVPDGYMFLGPDGAREFDRITENPDPGIDEYVLANKDMSWVAFFSFDSVGYVKDDEKLDPADLLKSVSDGTEASNEERRKNGWDPVHVSGWAFQPKYDPGIKSLEWAFRLKGENAKGESINYNTRLLGRHGVMQVLLLTSPENLTAAVADFKSRLPGYTFNAGETYGEYKAGDHVAEYGLAALVTGGAVAVAAKKGLFGVIGLFLLKAWKIVLVGFAAITAGVRRVFGKKAATT